MTSLLQGHDGRMWVGVDGKLCFVEPGSTRLQEVPGAVPVGGIASIAEDEHGDIWINTDHSLTGKLYRIHGSLRTEQVLPPEAKGVYTLTSDPAGGLWLGLRSGDLGHLKDGEFRLIPERHGKGFTPLRGISTNSSGFVMAGQLTALLLFRDGRSAVMGATNGLPFYQAELLGDGPAMGVCFSTRTWAFSTSRRMSWSAGGRSRSRNLLTVRSGRWMEPGSRLRG